MRTLPVYPWSAKAATNLPCSSRSSLSSSDASRLAVSLLSDGAPETCSRLDEAFDAETFDGAPVHKLIGFWHVIEKLSAAAHVIASKDDAPSLIARWKLSLLNRCGAREQILDEPIVSGRDHVRVGDVRPVHDAIGELARSVKPAREDSG